MNANTLKNWLIEDHKKLGVKLDSKEEISKLCQAHFCTASTNFELTGKFGIDKERVFGKLLFIF